MRDRRQWVRITAALLVWLLMVLVILSVVGR
jgi:hypothetical protein